MPPSSDHSPRPPRRASIPIAAAVMLGLVLGIFGYILFFAVAFRRATDDAIVYLPILALAPIAGVVARFAWPHWLTVAACVALPTAFWSALAFAAARAEGQPGATAHLAIAAAAAVAAFVGAFVGRRLATPRVQDAR